MKVVLLEDVKPQGRKGDVIEVNEGYARNFLIPKKKAVEATAGNLNTLRLQKANAEKIAAAQLEAAEKLAASVNAASVRCEIKGGEGGKAFGSITAKELAQALKEQSGVEIDRKKIVLAEPIRTEGSYEVPVKLHRDVTAILKVRVELS